MATAESTGHARILVGTEEKVLEACLLLAGPLTAEFVEGSLRAVRWHGAEVLRGIAYVVRDKDWGTFAPDLDALSVRQDPDGFHVDYTAVCVAADGHRLRYAARIEGLSDGRLTFAVDALPEAAFETNRCGFCVLHPIRGVAGQPVRVEHVDGSVETACFPDAIDPWQPFKAMHAISHEVAPGVEATCRFEGDVFEMEDQRNWSDGSYKTYVRPLALPWPYRLPGGEAFQQSVALSIADARTSFSPPPDHSEVVIGLGAPQGTMPRFGLLVTPKDAAATLRNASRLADVAPQTLLLHFDVDAGHGLQALRDLAAVRNLQPQAEAVLECVVPGRADPRDELHHLAELVRGAGLRLDGIAVSPSVDRQSTPPGSVWPDCPPLADVYAAARAAFPGLRLGGGMFSYFTELNRKRPPTDLLDFVTHGTCPIVHAADDLSVMQSLEALPFIVRSTRGFIGSTPYRIGPSTIGMRQNPYGSRTFDNPNGGRLTMTHEDPRQRGLFAAAWTVGYVAETLDGALEAFTAGTLTGAFGLMPADGDAVYPVLHVARGLAALAGSPRVPVLTAYPDRVLGFAAAPSGRTVLWLANITAEPEVVRLPPGAWRAAILDHGTWPEASTGRPPEVVPVGPTLALGPYATARLTL